MLWNCRGTDPSALPSRFAWLVGNLLLHGHLLLPQLANDNCVSDAAEYVGDMRQLQLGPSNSSPEDEPVALVSTLFCYVVSVCHMSSRWCCLINVLLACLSSAAVTVTQQAVFRSLVVACTKGLFSQGGPVPVACM